MKKLLCAIAGICLVSFVAGSALAGPPSAKFAAAWNDDMALTSVFYVPEDAEIVNIPSASGFTLATIKVPQDKELLVGVSAEIGLVTDTSVKGKNGEEARAMAEAEAFVTVYAMPTGSEETVSGTKIAAPGKIILSKRIQELKATLGGVIESCEDLDDDGIIDVKTECVVTDEEIGLMIETTAAHHFNFVLPDMDQGVYDIKAVFTTGANAEVDLVADCTVGEGEDCLSGSAYAKAIINKTMVTVQQVRAVKGSLADVEIVE